MRCNTSGFVGGTDGLAVFLSTGFFFRSGFLLSGFFASLFFARGFLTSSFESVASRFAISCLGSTVFPVNDFPVNDLAAAGLVKIGFFVLVLAVLVLAVLVLAVLVLAGAVLAALAGADFAVLGLIVPLLLMALDLFDELGLESTEPFDEAVWGTFPLRLTVDWVGLGALAKMRGFLGKPGLGAAPLDVDLVDSVDFCEALVLADFLRFRIAATNSSLLSEFQLASPSRLAICAKSLLVCVFRFAVVINIELPNYSTRAWLFASRPIIKITTKNAPSMPATFKSDCLFSKRPFTSMPKDGCFC